jgi:hypothetical protein
MERANGNDSDPVDAPLDPEDADDPGVAGGGGPAAIIYGEDEEAETHGDRLAGEPDDSV